MSERYVDGGGNIPVRSGGSGWNATQRELEILELRKEIAALKAATASRPEVQSGDARVRLFLSILNAAGGETSGNDDKWNWINYFCDDAEPLDTFNQASKRRLTRVTHDNDSDNSVVYLTEAGRAFISAPESTHVAQAVPDRQLYELSDEEYDAFTKALGAGKPPTQDLIDLMRGLSGNASIDGGSRKGNHTACNNRNVRPRVGDKLS